ncbi:THAP domain-containing protein 2-like [Palaemon carinicauda]|uniref:THAP domain-containing protein 2-like n=1 Tax=Palaemon carinicauda TaxID=392227 RepID=UPI0035B6A1BE
MAPSCAVLGCTKKFNKISNPSITFHRFPKDEVMRNEWVRALGRENFTPTIYSRLCSKHFREEDFIRTTLKVYLHSQAVPSVFEAFPEHLQRQEAEVSTSECPTPQNSQSEVNNLKRKIVILKIS